MRRGEVVADWSGGLRSGPGLERVAAALTGARVLAAVTCPGSCPAVARLRTCCRFQDTLRQPSPSAHADRPASSFASLTPRQSAQRDKARAPQTFGVTLRIRVCDQCYRAAAPSSGIVNRGTYSVRTGTYHFVPCYSIIPPWTAPFQYVLFIQSTYQYVLFPPSTYRVCTTQISMY
jgi:hypothetical protein